MNKYGSKPLDLSLPSNIEELLRTGVTPFKEHLGMATPLFNIKGYPHLLDRLETSEDFVDGVGRALASIEEARDFGVHALPSRLFVVDGYCHVVTKKVEGQQLDYLLREPTDQLQEQTDTLYANIGRYVIAAMKKGGHACYDIYGPNQYMYGTVSGDSESRLWLVDVPNEVRDLTRSEFSDQFYNLTVLDWINGIIEVETLADCMLRSARLVAAKAFELSRDTYKGIEWVAAFQGALDQRRILDSDEPPIEGLRTF